MLVGVGVSVVAVGVVRLHWAGWRPVGRELQIWVSPWEDGARWRQCGVVRVAAWHSSSLGKIWTPKRKIENRSWLYLNKALICIRMEIDKTLVWIKLHNYDKLLLLSFSFIYFQISFCKIFWVYRVSKAVFELTCASVFADDTPDRRRAPQIRWSWSGIRTRAPESSFWRTSGPESHAWSHLTHCPHLSQFHWKFPAFLASFQRPVWFISRSYHCRNCVDFFHYEGCPIHGTPFSKFPKVEQKRRVSVETCIIRLPPTAAALATALTKDLLFCRMGVTALLIFFFSLELFSSSCCIRLCFSLSGKEGSWNM